MAPLNLSWFCEVQTVYRPAQTQLNTYLVTRWRKKRLLELVVFVIADHVGAYFAFTVAHFTRAGFQIVRLLFYLERLPMPARVTGEGILAPRDHMTVPHRVDAYLPEADVPPKDYLHFDAELPWAMKVVSFILLY
jgi:hypothetical protein